MNWFIFNNFDSRQYPELIVNELPPITKPEMRYEITYLDGVDGGIVETKGYAQYDKSMQISLKDISRIDEIVTALTGAGTIEFSNEPNKLYNVGFYGRIDYNRLGRFRQATVTMLAQPYKYLKNDPEYVCVSLTQKTFEVYNNGSVESLPLIDLSAAATLQIGDNQIQTSAAVVLDSESQNAYQNGVLKNSVVIGEFLKLPPGKSLITITGNVTAKIKPRSRFI